MTTQNTHTETVNYQQIFNSIINKINNRQTDFFEELRQEQSINNILENWRFSSYLTKANKMKSWQSVGDLKNFILQKRIKQDAKYKSEQTSRLNAIFNAKEVKCITLSIDWKKSQMWGHNPQATAKVTYLDNITETFYSDRVSGAGYDKESTAFANAMNQINGILNKMISIKNDNISKDNRDLFGYGTQGDFIPSFAGGVGVSCYYNVLESIGYKLKHIANGQTFDVYTIEKISE
jgi:hypothetical protein